MEVLTEKKNIIKELIDLIEAKKGENLIIIDISEISTIADYIFVVTANSITHSNSLTRYILDFFTNSEYKDMLYQKNIELNNPWILIDATNIIIHIFLQETREFYSIEKLYFKGKIIYKAGGMK